MLEGSSLFWLCSILIVTQNLHLSRGKFIQKWIRQNQDHFDPSNPKSWFMRYYENDEFYHHPGPIFILIGGESALSPTSIKTDSIMYEMAETYQAMMYSIEHRYYGRSHPVLDTSFNNLRYLTIPQVLADIALFIETTKRELNNSNAFIMVFGSSYAGNLAAWMRVLYPNLVQAALASSAPIYIKADFFDYFFDVENTIRKYDENCAVDIKKAFSALEELIDSSESNSIKLKDDFKLCDVQDFSQPSEIQYMMMTLAEIFSHAVVYNKIEVNGKTSIENLCTSMKGNEITSSYYRLAGVFTERYLKNNSCINLDYSDLIEQFVQTSWESEAVDERMWLYQTCTELGYFATLSSPGSIFGCRSPVQYFVNLCADTFEADHNVDRLYDNIRKINHTYNSKLSTTTNIIFMNGDHDPWRSLSVLSDLNEDSPAIVVNGAAHCQFGKCGGVQGEDSMIVARCQISFIIYEWLQNWSLSVSKGT